MQFIYEGFISTIQIYQLMNVEVLLHIHGPSFWQDLGSFESLRQHTHYHNRLYKVS